MSTLRHGLDNRDTAVGKRAEENVQIVSGALPTSYSMGTGGEGALCLGLTQTAFHSMAKGLFLQGYSGRTVMLTTHLHLVPRLRI